MSYKSKSVGLPPLEDGGWPGSSPGQNRRRKPSYEYKSDSSSPTSTTPSPRSSYNDSPRSSNSSPRKPEPISPRFPGTDVTSNKKAGNKARSPRKPRVDINKEFRTLCIGSPVPESADFHADDMVIHANDDKREGVRNRRDKAPSITIDKVEELHLVGAKSPRGGRPISPASYELIEHSRSTPFSKSRSNERLLSIEPSSPPVERKGKRQVINYYREKDVNRSKSDGNLPEYSTPNGPNEESRRHQKAERNRSHTEGNEDDQRAGNDGMRRAASPGQSRLTRRARENETTPNHNYAEPHGRSRGKARRQEEEEGEEESEESEDSQSPEPRRSNRHRQDDEDRSYGSPNTSPREEVKKPIRLQPLNMAASGGRRK